MGSRLELQTLLESLLESRNVYFQPPASLSMKYPAIVYSLDDIENTHANNRVYTQMKSYTLTFIHDDPDSEVIDLISKLPLCVFDRHYASNNLNHDVFKLYF